MKRLSFLAIVALLSACGQGQSPKTPEPKAQEVEVAHKAFDVSHKGKPAPDIALETGPDGKTTTLAQMRQANPGKPILVNLWATWCAPCIRELPTLNQLAVDTKGQLIVLPLSQDMEGWRAITPFLAKNSYPDLQPFVESSMQFGLQVGAKGLPLTILYDAKGLEVWRYSGDRDWAAADARKAIGV